MGDSYADHMDKFGTTDRGVAHAAHSEAAVGGNAGLKMTDILALPDPLRGVVNWMVRKREVGLGDLAERLQQDEASTRETMGELLERGYLWETRVGGETRYRLRLAPQPRRHSKLPEL